MKAPVQLKEISEWSHKNGNRKESESEKESQVPNPKFEKANFNEVSQNDKS